ncbi:MAG: hypothetical protein ABI175_27880 [Polyangiales bacterium]
MPFVRSLGRRFRPRHLAALVAVLVVSLGLVAHLLGGRVTTRDTYCTVCALHATETERTSLLHVHGMPLDGWFHEVKRDERRAVLHKLLAPAVGAHEHRWMTPAAFVPPTSPMHALEAPDDFLQAVALAEVSDLEQLEQSPHLLAVLDEAMRDDRERAVRFIQRILDPRAYLGMEAIGLLDRDAASWDERWSIADAFLETYRCSANDTEVTCRMHAGATDLIVLARTATAVHGGTVDWPRWLPEGHATPTSGDKKLAAAVTN